MNALIIIAIVSAFFILAIMSTIFIVTIMFYIIHCGNVRALFTEFIMRALVIISFTIVNTVFTVSYYKCKIHSSHIVSTFITENVISHIFTVAIMSAILI